MEDIIKSSQTDEIIIFFEKLQTLLCFFLFLLLTWQHVSAEISQKFTKKLIRKQINMLLNSEILNIFSLLCFLLVIGTKDCMRV